MHKETIEVEVPDVIKVSNEDFCKNPKEYLENLSEEDILDVNGVYILSDSLMQKYESAHYEMEECYTCSEEDIKDITKEELFSNPKKILSSVDKYYPTWVDEDWVIMPGDTDVDDIINTLKMKRLGFGRYYM